MMGDRGADDAAQPDDDDFRLLRKLCHVLNPDCCCGDLTACRNQVQPFCDIFWDYTAGCKGVCRDIATGTSAPAIGTTSCFISRRAMRLTVAFISWRFTTMSTMP